MTTTTTPPHTAPFSLEVYPLVARAKSGPAHYQVTVINKGSKPLQITASTKDLHGACAQLKFSPAHFTLAPQQVKQVTVSAGPGSTDYLAAFSGHVPGQGMSVSAAVGTRFIIGTPGTHATVCHAPKATPIGQHPASGFPWLAVLIAAVLAALIVGVVWHRHRNKNRSK